jgi:hypothetical protein
MGLRASDAQKSGDRRKSRLPMFARLPNSYEHLSNAFEQCVLAKPDRNQ